MADDLIRYDLLVQEALRGVVRRVLSNAARDGLPGSHYFHVEFLTASPGVRLSDRMRERFPDRMTIILQHHFWDLEVNDEALEVGLSFGGVGERVRVPFAAVTGFFDESVQFGLRFEVEDDTAKALAEEAPEAAKKPARKSRKADAEAIKLEAAKPEAEKPEADKPAAGKSDSGKSGSGKSDAGKSDADRADDKPDAPEEGAKVVSLSAFRKKP